MYPRNPVVSKIKNLIETSEVQALFCWVPSHRGIGANERVDALTIPEERIASVDIAKNLFSKIMIGLLRVFQEQWTQSANMDNPSTS